MATVVNYTCKSLIKLIPGYSLYHLIAVCVKILGGGGGGGGGEVLPIMAYTGRLHPKKGCHFQTY